MPTPLQIITKGCALASTTYDNYPDKSDPTGIRDFNVIYKDIISDMRPYLKEDYFWTYAYEDTVIDQNEYNIETFDAGGDTLDITEIKKVLVKYKDTDYYTPASRETAK